MRALSLTGHSTAQFCAVQTWQCAEMRTKQKGVLLSVCTVGHRGPVWFWILVLSVLCRLEWVCSALDTKDVQECLDNLNHSIQKSTGQLYAPSVDEIKENCELHSLICYMLELNVVFLEEQLDNDDTDCVAAFNGTLSSITELNTGRCPPCEATAPRSATTFLDNLKRLMEKLNSLHFEREMGGKSGTL